jgi:GMP synthase (glutamine-hydrolysing)
MRAPPSRVSIEFTSDVVDCVGTPRQPFCGSLFKQPGQPAVKRVRHHAPVEEGSAKGEAPRPPKPLATKTACGHFRRRLLTVKGDDGSADRRPAVAMNRRGMVMGMRSDIDDDIDDNIEIDFDIGRALAPPSGGADGVSGSARVLVLRTGQPVSEVEARSGSFAHLFARSLNGEGHEGGRVIVDAWDITTHAADDPLPSCARYDGVVMTGSAAYVGDDAPWMRFGQRLLRAFIDTDVPFLGVCFGHQLLGQALGADVGPNPRGREMGTVDVELHVDVVAGDRLWSRASSSFAANVTHRDERLARGSVSWAARHMTPATSSRPARTSGGSSFIPSSMTSRCAFILRPGGTPSTPIEARARLLPASRACVRPRTRRSSSHSSRASPSNAPAFDRRTRPSTLTRRQPLLSALLSPRVLADAPDF